MEEQVQLSIDVDDRGGGGPVVVAVAGELDFATTPALLDAAVPLAEAGRELVLDLDGLVFCDSSALSALVRLHKAATGSGGSLLLARPRSAVLAALRMATLDRLFAISDGPPPGGARR
ncbi:STAS domain-containing protein [Saccharothrix coeruleofusca]|uniref:STAS domain-containing protein n=1 Tax=Saccharothrix coeruleofusca TaxID=33919 RepID=UPI001670A6F2|nr:STAS domain-containing protein [Saccharothrix coeruleofusca]